VSGAFFLYLRIRRCRNAGCQAYCRPYRPEAEGRYALPHHEFGLDVIALIGALRYGQHRSLTEIHSELIGRGLVVSQRTVTNLLDRYDELVAVTLTDNCRLRKLLAGQGRVILAIDGLRYQGRPSKRASASKPRPGHRRLARVGNSEDFFIGPHVTEPLSSARVLPGRRFPSGMRNRLGHSVSMAVPVRLDAATDAVPLPRATGLRAGAGLRGHPNAPDGPRVERPAEFFGAR
jgi:hypothetical protein